MPQLNFSAPQKVKEYLEKTKPSDKSLSRYILDLVVLGLTKCGGKRK